MREHRISAEEAVRMVMCGRELPRGSVIECKGFQDLERVREAFRKKTWPVSTRADWPSEPGGVGSGWWQNVPAETPERTSVEAPDRQDKGGQNVPPEQQVVRPNP